MKQHAPTSSNRSAARAKTGAGRLHGQLAIIEVEALRLMLPEAEGIAAL